MGLRLLSQSHASPLRGASYDTFLLTNGRRLVLLSRL
jgi:hypothetical protein